MPHSGGGGSFSGGLSISSGGRSYSDGGAKERTQSTPFEKCLTYVAYDRLGNSRLVYSNLNKFKEESTGIFYSVFVLYVGLALLFVCSVAIYALASECLPQNLGELPPVEIIDVQDLVPEDEEVALTAELTAFRDQTGITTAVEFTTEEAWQAQTDSLETYSYDRYLQLFDDERHLLLVYSYGAEDEAADIQEFSWHTMWGNDLGRIAGVDDEAWLAKTLQERFRQAGGHGIPAVLVGVFQDFIPEIEKTTRENNLIMAAVLVLFLVPGVFMTYYGVKMTVEDIKKMHKMRVDGVKTYRITGEPTPIPCKYCGCICYQGTVHTCPHCGAPLEESTHE